MRLVEVIVDAPMPQPLQYLLDDADTVPTPGSLGIVPLGRRRVPGIAVGHAAEPRVEAGRLRRWQPVPAALAPFDLTWLELTRFAAQYYQHAWGETALPALPPLLRTAPGPRFESVLRRARAASFVAPPNEAAHFGLTPDQRAAADAVDVAAGFRPFLLHGVTGSGKTEVYCELIARLLVQRPQAQALVLVPEINLTPQLEGRLQARFPGLGVASLHSGLADAQRNAAWLAAHEGRVQLLLGTRSAVFASLPRLGLVIVDEEHDASFKAGDGVRYSARDLALKRAQLVGVPVVLGSATPALETWARAEDARLTRLSLPRRATRADMAPPVVTTVDLRTQPLQHGLAAPVREALAATVARREQALVFLNRRGFAPVLACAACGWLSACPRCSVFAAFHKVDATLRCHHCGWQAPVPRACPTCGNQAIDAVGHGTQRIEEALRELLPQARVARIDRDSTSRRGAAGVALAAVHAGEVDVLVGTQMIAKGHDFQGVTLVVVLNADAQLVAPDFRAAERLFATLLQVIGRAGRSGAASRALIQTRYPEHPLYRALQAQDFVGFARQQLDERRRAHMPPFVHQALLTAEARGMERALDFLRAARDRAQQLGAAVQCYDAVPMPIARRAGVERAQMVLEAARRPPLQQLLGALLADLRADRDVARGVRWQIDVDPLEI